MLVHGSHTFGNKYKEMLVQSVALQAFYFLCISELFPEMLFKKQSRRGRCLSQIPLLVTVLGVTIAINLWITQMIHW